MVRTIMTKNVKTVGHEDTVKDAVEKMNKFNIGSVVVMDTYRKTPLGIITERDILRLVERYTDPLLINVKQVMSYPLVTVDVDTSIEEAARIMAKKQIKRLATVEDGKLVGIVSSSDIMRASPRLVNILTNLLKR